MNTYANQRIEEERAKKRAAAIREKQAQVDVSATAAKPTDTFRNRFENIDKRLANVEKAVPVQQPRHAKLAMNAAEPDTSTSDSVQTKTLLETMVQLERSVSDLRMSCLTVASEMTSPSAKTLPGRLPPSYPKRPRNESGRRKQQKGRPEQQH